MDSAAAALDRLGAIAAFEAAGAELALVGGPVRDAFLSRTALDLDFTTDADPDRILQIVRPIASAHWDVGRAFGTIGARIAGEKVEITTYRSDAYSTDSRKPEVRFGSTLEEDLVRRDFTVNAMALRLPARVLVDPTGGIADLVARRLRTPQAPEISFSDDPLRMLRAARFTAQLGFELDGDARRAMTELAGRLDIVSAERMREELARLILAPNPRPALELLVETGIADLILPELPALRLTVDTEHRHKDVYQHSLTVLDQTIGLEEERKRQPDLILRVAALLHDIGKPATRRFEPGGTVTFHHHDAVGAKLARKRLRALRFDNDTIAGVAHLIELHQRFFGYTEGVWTDSAVRRYVRDADGFLEELHILTRADVTTRNRRKAERLAKAYDDLEARIAVLAEQEELAAVRPDLDGEQIMAILGVPPGPAVGIAYRHLLELRLDEGPLGQDEATARLLSWWESAKDALPQRRRDG
jgi:poly(A) polymerase